MNKRRTRSPFRLGDIGESGWLRRLAPMLARQGRGVVVGFGDDAACLAFPTGSQSLLLVTTDLLIEGTHFTEATATAATLGEKSVAVNVSDIAAMGGRPTALVAGLGAPPDYAVERLETIYRAVEAACRRWDIAFVGGDTIRSERLILAPTLLGEFDGPAERLPLRNRMRKGQHLYVTGTVGDSAAGLDLMLQGRNRTDALRLPAKERRHLIERHRRPQPRLIEGQLLARHFDDLALIDLSDDLAKSVRLLSAASRVGVTVLLEWLPVSVALRKWCCFVGKDVMEAALFGGEDYELLFATGAAPAEVTRLFRAHRIPTPVSAIGRVGGRGVRWLDRRGRTVDFPPRAFEHFCF